MTTRRADTHKKASDPLPVLEALVMIVLACIVACGGDPALAIVVFAVWGLAVLAQRKQ